MSKSFSQIFFFLSSINNKEFFLFDMNSLILLTYKGIFVFMKKKWDFYVSTLKMMWNVQKIGLEKMSGWK